jgi:hypothetical protein
VDREETRRAFMLTTGIREVLRLDLTAEHWQFAKLVQKQREYTQALKNKMKEDAAEAQGSAASTSQDRGKRRAAPLEPEARATKVSRLDEIPRPQGVHQYHFALDSDDEYVYDDPTPQPVVPKALPIDSNSNFYITDGSHVWHLVANQNHNTINIHSGTNHIYLDGEPRTETKTKRHAEAEVEFEVQNVAGKHAMQASPPSAKQDKGKARVDNLTTVAQPPEASAQPDPRSIGTRPQPREVGQKPAMSEKERLRPRPDAERSISSIRREHDKHMIAPPPLPKSRRSKSRDSLMYNQKPRSPPPKPRRSESRDSFVYIQNPRSTPPKPRRSGSRDSLMYIQDSRTNRNGSRSPVSLRHRSRSSRRAHSRGRSVRNESPRYRSRSPRQNASHHYPTLSPRRRNDEYMRMRD